MLESVSLVNAGSCFSGVTGLSWGGMFSSIFCTKPEANQHCRADKLSTDHTQCGVLIHAAAAAIIFIIAASSYLYGRVLLIVTYNLYSHRSKLTR